MTNEREPKITGILVVVRVYSNVIRQCVGGLLLFAVINAQNSGMCIGNRVRF